MSSRCTHVWFGVLLVFSSAIATSESVLYQGPDRAIDAAFFGMHIHRSASGTSWPAVPFADWRLWDAGVAWPQLEPERGKWNFTLLDRYVEIAANRHVEILLTLGLTPVWASSHPNQRSAYTRGNAAEPEHLADWEEYVRVVATRYKGVIHDYEIWNEPNVKGTFSGGMAAMLELSRAAYQVLKSVDPAVNVVSPSATSDTGVQWLEAFLQSGGCQYSDVIGYHFYVIPESPEAMVSLIKRIEVVSRKYGCSNKPLWNTESGWTEPKRFTSEEEAAGYLMRTYILDWLLGIQRCYWYAWDNHNWSTLDLTSRSDDHITKAGLAYGVIHQWMLESILRSCQREASGLWICQLNHGGSTSRVLWSERTPQRYTIPASWHVQRISTWTGDVETPRVQIRIGPAPLLLVGN